MTDASFDADLDADLDTALDAVLDAPLPTFAILARFREGAPSEDLAIDAVRRRLVDKGVTADTVTLERQDDDGTWLVVARVVTVSIDAHTAVAGIVEDLTAAGLVPDEVWVQRQIA